ncbi:MAG: H-NS histone family protein [Comamonadaceae bacterium]|nr:MAG: H-NS histone family protein [Comamonadaceae bacterium]
MAQTLQSIEQQFYELQRRAAKLRNDEVDGVIDRIKVAIAHYGLTAEQLGLSAKKSTAKQRSAKPVGRKADAAKYADGTGNEWSGRGPRPHWSRDALAAGRGLDEFKTEASIPRKSAASAKPARKRKAGRQYRDASGNQ